MEPSAQVWVMRRGSSRIVSRIEGATENDGSRMPERFTKLQGQYLAYIATYTKLHRRPPAEADLQAYFQVTPPSVHNMILTLDRLGLIERVPGQARSIRVRLAPDTLPALE
jgi:DNA-binding MarR family transcriptional regulator